jgi:hypothetical protein
MSLPNDSIANLLVTRKSLHASNDRTSLARNRGHPFPVPFGEADDTKRGRANKKAGAGKRRHGLESKAGAGKSAGWAQGIFSRRGWRREDRLMNYFWMLA